MRPELLGGLLARSLQRHRVSHWKGALIVYRLLGVVALMFIGCGQRITSPSTPEEARSSLARDTSPAAPAADVASVVDGNTAFAFALHRQLVSPGQNLMTSPYSVSLALGMTYVGARGETATQLASALHFALPADRFAPALDAIDLALMTPAACVFPPCAPFSLRLANAAWAQKGLSLEPTYLDTLARSFGVGVKLADFRTAAEPARLAINQWVAEETEQKIRDLLPAGSVDPSTRLVLVNAVYFKGTWATQFDARQTTPSNFTLLGGETTSVPTLHGGLETRAVTGASFDAVELPYRDSHFAMLVIVPARGTFDAFEQSFGPEQLAALDASLGKREVTLSLPKFSFHWGKSLVPALTALGLTDAFDASKADFSGITTAERLFFSDVIHQSYVGVDEIGTEAAAATAVVLAGASAPGQKVTITVDRPFLFAIRDTTTGTIAFLGRVVDPR